MRLVHVSVLGLVGLLSCGGCEDEPIVGNLVRQIDDASLLIVGIEATGRVGDYVLDNGSVRFIVQEPGSSTGWGLFGGSLVDIDAVRADGRLGNDLLEELFVQCDLRGFAPERAEIISDGAGGTDGVLRLVGKDAGIPFLDAIITRDPLDVTMTVDFILPPTGRTLELRIAVKDERKTRARDIGCGFILLPGDAYELTSPNHRRGEGVGGKNDYLAASAPAATTSYVLYGVDGGTVDVVLDGLGILPIAPDPVPFLANATVEERYFLSVGDNGDLESAFEARRAYRADPTPRRTVELDLGVDVPVDDLSVLFVDSNGLAATSLNHIAGPASVKLPTGTYEAVVRGGSYELGRFSVEVTAGDGSQKVVQRLETIGILSVISRGVGLDGADEGPTPVRLRVVEGAGASVGAGALYEAYVPANVDLVLPAGTYTLVVSRGPEHEFFVQDVTIVAGQTEAVNAELVRVVDSTGWVSADLHVHGTRSADSETSRRMRVLGAAAEGLEILVGTDHDAVTDYGPTVAELALESQLRAVPGIEMSMLYGHINGYPVPSGEPQDHWRPGWFIYDDNGRFERMRDPHEVAETLRSEGARIVQLNHPRSSTGVFNYLGLDENGETEKTWPDVDAVELLNGKRVDEYPLVLADLGHLLERGRFVTAVGSSDVHADFGIGYGRTFVKSTTDDAASINLDEIWTALSAGHAVASYGPFLVARIVQADRSAGPGEVLKANGPVAIEVRVEAPSWMDVETLEVFENGQSIAVRALGPEDADPVRPAVRFTGTVTATPTVDSYYFVEVRGRASPPILDQTRATVNAIRVDADGNGWQFR